MLFLIEYDRNRGRIVTFRKFHDVERQKAEDARLEMELERNRPGTEREVVLLEAATEEAMQHTHSRYFEGLPELIADLAELVNSPAG